MATRERTAGSGEGSGPGRAAGPARAVRAVRWVLIGLLMASAALTLFGFPALQRAVAGGGWPPVAVVLGAALLALFAIGYAGYRIVLVRAGRYPAGKALVRIALMAAVVGVVVGLVRAPPDGRAPGLAPVDLERTLLSADPDVRALAAEVVRHRPRAQALRAVPRLLALLEDRSPEVRRQARLSLAALAGRDVGGEGPDAPARWRDYWRDAGR
ncbi:MAG TPA: HEAT repeat domain-containing protein [Anaeromyxobacter sp.]